MNASKTSTELTAAVPPALRQLAEGAVQAGGRAYLVGGGVRDVLLGRASKDFDVEVFGLPVDALERFLRKSGHVNAVGRSFGVLKWRPRGHGGAAEIDVSIPRRDSKNGPGHRGIAVEGDPDMPIEEAARRRDLTINALMYDIAADELVDPWGGLEDLRAGRLREVDPDTFLEDPLRALRVAQFAARLGFEPTPTLLELCTAAALDELPAERVQGEWGKLLLRGRLPSLGFSIARRAKILERVFPEVASATPDTLLDALVPARDRMKRDDVHGEGRAWALMLTAWLAAASPSDVVATLDRLWLHKVHGYNVREHTCRAVAALRHAIASDADLRHLSTHAEVQLVLEVRMAEGSANAESAAARAQTLDVWTAPPPPLLQGRDLKTLGIPAGPAMGRLLKQVYAMQLDGLVQTHDEARTAAQRLV